MVAVRAPRIIVFPKDLQWFGGIRWPGCIADVRNVSFPISFQWFEHSVDDGLARIIVFPMGFQWFGDIRWPRYIADVRNASFSISF